MKRATVLTAALSVAFVVGACSDDSARLPTAESQAFLTTGGPACSPADLQSATQAIFGEISDEAGLASEFTLENANTSAVTPYAYQLFDAIADRRDSPYWSVEDVPAAAELSVQITACSDLVFTEPDLPGSGTALHDAFSGALGAGGTYAVRGGTYDEAPVLSDDAQAGLQAEVSFANWLSGPALILGYPLLMPFGDETHGGAGYDWFLLQAQGQTGLTGSAAAALCTPEVPAQAELLRLQHLPTADGGHITPYVVAENAPPVECDASPPPVISRTTSLGARLLAALGTVVVPPPLHAAAVAFGPVSGLLGSFSPVEVVYPEEVRMEFVAPPADGFVETPNPIAVRVTAAGGTPWGGVLVTLTPMANDGRPQVLCGATAETNAEGVAEFPLFRVGKPGGLYLVATTSPSDVDVGGYETVSVESARFVTRPARGTTIPCS